MKPRQIVLYEAALDRPRQAQADTGGYTVLTGRAVPYGVFTNRGWYLEAVGQGAFDKSIQEAAGTGLPLHLFHDSETFPVGVSTAWESRPDALYGTWRLDKGPEAQRAAALADDGLLVYLSVGHAPIRNSWDLAEDWDPDLGPDHMDRLTRVESRLVEVSMLTAPAFPQAQVLSVAAAARDPEIRRRRDIIRPSLRAWQDWAATLPR